MRKLNKNYVFTSVTNMNKVWLWRHLGLPFSSFTDGSGTLLSLM